MNNGEISSQKNIIADFFKTLFGILLPLILLFILWLSFSYGKYYGGLAPLAKQIFSRKLAYAFGTPPISIVILTIFLMGALIRFGFHYFEELRKLAPIKKTYIIIFVYGCLFMQPSTLAHSEFLMDSLGRNAQFLLNVFIAVLLLFVIEAFTNFAQLKREFLTLKIHWTRYLIGLPFWYFIAAWAYMFSFFVGVE